MIGWIVLIVIFGIFVIWMIGGWVMRASLEELRRRVNLHLDLHRRDDESDPGRDRPGSPGAR